MLPLVAAKKTASVIALMMLELLAFYVSRPAMFLSSAAIANDISLVQTCNRKSIWRTSSISEILIALSRSSTPITRQLLVRGPTEHQRNCDEQQQCSVHSVQSDAAR